jgi:hypothetical protein
LLPFDDGLNDVGWVDLARCGCDCPTGKHDDHGHDENHGQDDKHDQPVDDHDHHHSVETPAHGGSSRSGTMMSEALDICAAAEEGMWELLPCDSQVLAVHAVLMHTGKVLFFAGSGNSVPHFNAHDSRSVVWDYHNGTFHRPTTPFDVFCAGQTLLADGKVLIVGGTDAYDNFVGSHASYIFDPQIEEWIRLSDMAAGRWYPSVVTLGDGRAVAASGAQAANEAYAPATNWTPVAATTFLPLYPHLILMADGRLFYSGGQLGQATVEPRLISPDSGAETVVPGLRDNGHRDQSCTVLLPPAQDQRVMILGGGPGTSTATVDIADLGARSMGSYGPAANLHEARTLHNTVILPDRTVFVSGGGLRGETRQDAVRVSEIYDPVTNSWRRTATASVSRLYHSIALLLPDGRVVTAGSNPDRGDDELRLELFHPPYLFKGPRPFIQTAPTGVNYGSEFAIHTPQATSIAWVHLVRPMAVTHSDDCSQRLVDLPIEHRDTCHLHVKLTDNCNLAPPGWYMLFLCDDHGVPSVARWVHVGPLVEAHSFDDHHEGHPAHQHPIGHLHAPGFPIPGFELLVPPATRPATKPKRTARRAPSTRKAK